MSKLLYGFVKVAAWICQSCFMYFLPLAKQDQAEFWQRLQSFLKLLLWTKGKGWVNALGPLCLWRCLIINMKHAYDYDETNSSVQCPLSFLLCLLLSAQYLHHEASGPLIHCIYISFFVWSLSFFFSCIFLQGKGSEKKMEMEFSIKRRPLPPSPWNRPARAACSEDQRYLGGPKSWRTKKLNSRRKLGDRFQLYLLNKTQ